MNHAPSHRGLVLLLALGMLLVVGARGASAQTPPAPQVFAEVIEVRVVEVEVVVTDEDGQRVQGLRRDDFRLVVGGKEMPIEYFDERRDGTLRSPRTADAAPRPEGIHYLLFLDDYFTDRRYRGAVLDRAIEEIEELGSADRMAVVRFRGRGVETLADWTGSRGELRGVLQQARKSPSWELKRRTRLQTVSNPANRVRVLASQIEEAQQTLTATMRAYSDAPGRKVLLLLSAGWPFQLPYDDTSAGARIEANRRGGGRLLRPVTDTANLLGYTIYTFHLGNLGQNPDTAARNPQGVFFNDPGNLASLQRLARQTGGQSFAYSTLIPRPLSAVVEDTANYYSLGFRAPMSGDGATRTIAVRLSRPGLEVRHRAGYRDLTRAERANLEAEAALLSGAAKGPPLEVAFAEAGRGLRSRQVPFTVRIPMDWVTMLPVGDGLYGARLELRIGALDKAGDRSEITALPIDLRGPEPPPGSHSVYEAAVKLRTKKQRVVFTLTDPLSGQSLTSTLDFEP